MADLVIAAANVVKSTGAEVKNGTAGAAITAGQVVYRDAATGKYLLADNNSATAAARNPVGIALNGAAADQPVAVQIGGDITIGAALTAGTEYWLSDTPGGISPRADLLAGEYPVLIGVAKSTTVLALNIVASGVSL